MIISAVAVLVYVSTLKNSEKGGEKERILVCEHTKCANISRMNYQFTQSAWVRLCTACHQYLAANSSFLKPRDGAPGAHKRVPTLVSVENNIGAVASAGLSLRLLGLARLQNMRETFNSISPSLYAIRSCRVRLSIKE